MTLVSDLRPSIRNGNGISLESVLLVLDGSASMDPDSPSSADLTYLWTCDSYGEDCLDGLDMMTTEPTLSFDPVAATVNLIAAYVFTLTISSGSRMSSVSVSREFSEASPVGVSIRMTSPSLRHFGVHNPQVYQYSETLLSHVLLFELLFSPPAFTCLHLPPLCRCNIVYLYATGV